MTVMHRASPAPGISMRVDDGESIVLGKLRLQVLHTPGHTADSMCLVGEDRVFTGDTLLIGGTGRTDLPTGDPEALYDSLFGKLLALDPALLVYPAHDYKGRSHSTIGAEIDEQPAPAEARARRLRGDDEEPRPVDADPPHRGAAHQHERRQDGRRDARRGDRARAVHEHGRAARARRERPPTSSSSSTCARRTPTRPATSRARASCRAASSSCASTRSCPIRRARIVTCCEFGRISTLAASTLRTMGFQRAVALDGGMKSWLEAGYPTRAGALP